MQRQHKSLGTDELLHPFHTICMLEAETFHLYICILHKHISSFTQQSLTVFLWVCEGQLPARDIPNFDAALGKSPRSMVPKDKRLFEYLKNWTSVWVCLKRLTVKWGDVFSDEKLTWWRARESSGLNEHTWMNYMHRILSAKGVQSHIITKVSYTLSVPPRF